jgi:hypothetical protein
MGVTPLRTYTGLREMEGAPRGGYASVDTVDRRDSELRSPLNRPVWGACGNGCILRVWLSIHIYRCWLLVLYIVEMICWDASETALGLSDIKQYSKMGFGHSLQG